MQPLTCSDMHFKCGQASLGRLRLTSFRQPSVALRASRPAAGRLFQDLRPLREGSPSGRPLWRLARRVGFREAEYSLAPASDSLIEENYVPKGALLSAQLPADVCRRAEDAIAKRDYRVTVRTVVGPCPVVSTV
jgi:hypothetical protein